MNITYTTTTNIVSSELLIVDGAEQFVNKIERVYVPDQSGLTSKSWFIGEHMEGNIAFLNKERKFVQKILDEWLVEAGYDPMVYYIQNKGPGSATIIEKGKVLDKEKIQSWTKPHDETLLPSTEAETI